MNNYLITGTSSGLGMHLARELSKNNNVIGVSKSQTNFEEKNFKNFIFNFQNEVSKELIKTIKDVFKNEKFTLIINAGINFSDFDDNLTNFQKSADILKVNYFNQMFSFLRIAEEMKFLINKVVFISSYDAFYNRCYASFGYSLSKSLILETGKILNRYKKTHNISSKVVILAGVDTKMYRDNVSAKTSKERYLNFLRKPIAPEYAAKKIINFIYTKKRVLFLPKKFKYIAILSYIVEFFLFVK